MKHTFTLLLFIHCICSVYGQNPIGPTGLYLADPTVRVWMDGKLYVYGSLDESTDHYCSHKHHMLSTSDLINWELTENIFSSVGDNDEVPYSDDYLFAPDCMLKDSTYYLYYCQPSRKGAEGVATSNSPTGPFKNGRIIDLGGIQEIDPAVFIDDDGQGYYIWGQFQAKIARLNLDMIGIDTSSISTVANEEEHFFHEGAFMLKRNGIYYLVYTDISRGNRPTCIGYSTSKSPMGPFKYGGVIIDNRYCDPETWNNHGSIAEFKEQWYVFYHRSTHNSRMMRKACIEPIYFNEDGSIDEVEMTSQGAGAPLKATEKIDAERACLLFGNVRIQLYEQYNEMLSGIRVGDNAGYKFVDFGDGVDEVQLRLKPLKSGGNIYVRLDQPWGPIIGIVNVKGAENSDWITIKSGIRKTSGIHTLWFTFKGKGDELYEVDWLKFNSKSK